MSAITSTIPLLTLSKLVDNQTIQTLGRFLVLILKRELSNHKPFAQDDTEGTYVSSNRPNMLENQFLLAETEEI